MPEGPELRHSRDVISQILVGNKIHKMEVASSGRYKTSSPVGYEQITKELPLLVESIDVKGKFMWWTFMSSSGNRWYMHCTYGMAGGWFTSKGNHTCFSVDFNGSGVPITRDSRTLFFNDMRHFGTIKFVSSEEEHKKKLSTIGPCVFDENMTPEIFAKRLLRKPSRVICEALMDQASVSGIGNYLRAEILYDCAINPWRSVTDISSEEYINLHEKTVAISKQAYLSQGATIKTYRTADDSAGSAQFSFKAYGKKVDPLGNEIVREEDSNGRTIHWCPAHQK